MIGRPGGSSPSMIGPIRTSRNEARRTGRTVVFWAILVLWTVVLVEGFAAAYFLFFARTHYRPVYLEQPNDHWLWRTEYHDWGAWHKPSSTASHVANCFSVSYRSNSYGARDRERSRTATAPRAVVLGDSFVEGFAVDEDRRLSNLLEQALGFEMLNFGMTHFGPLQYQLLYEKLALGFDHDVVIVGLLPDNDFTGNDPDFNRRFDDFARRYRPYYSKDGTVFYPRSRPSPDEPSPFVRQAGDLRGRRNLVRKFFHLFWVYGLYRDIRWNVSVLEHPQRPEYVGYFENDATRISHVTGSLLAIQRSAAPRPMLVVFLPDYKSWDYVERHPGSTDKSVVVALRAVLEQNGIRTVDLLEEFRKRGLDKDSLCSGNHREPP
jgi:hypothetical protein